MNTQSPGQCPQCGQAISNGIRGLCPNCLAMIGFGPVDDPAMPPFEADETVRSTGKPLIAPVVKYFGDYELLEEVARGGMGVVFKARQKSLNRVVAVKMIRGGQLATAEDVKRFRAEAEAAGNLQHPNIVAIHEIGEHAGQHYFSMDLVDGPTLAELVRTGPLATGQAAQYVQAIAQTVQFAHQRGILHRDLKPSNVLVDSQDRVRVTDFGLAKVMHGDSNLTRSGDVMGSPAYMAPEQAQANRQLIGPPSDVYSLGALLYHLLTGQPPFQGETAVDVLRKALDEEPVPPSHHNPRIPTDLETICLKCLAKRPEQRYATARELAEELERFLNYEPILAKPASGWRRTWNWTQKNPWVLAAALASLVVFFAGAAYGLYERTGYLNWHLSTGMTPERNALGSPCILFFKIFPLLALLLYVGRNAFLRSFQADPARISAAVPRNLLAHAGIGLLTMTAGLGCVMVQIKGWAWNLSVAAMVPMEIIGLLLALGVAGYGLYTVWEAAGGHESSRFRGTVDRALERELAKRACRWSPGKLLMLVAWLLAVAAVVGLLTRYYLFRTSQELLLTVNGGVAGMLAGFLLVRVLRQRSHLFWWVFLPLAVTGFAAALAAVHLVLIMGYEGPLGFVAMALLFLLITTSAGHFIGVGKLAAATAPRRFPGNVRRQAWAGVAVFLALFLMMHLVENWRGRRAWERVSAELTARGESLDYAAFVKPPVPDDQNVMEHPYMKRHFIKGTQLMPVEHPSIERTGFHGHPYLLADLKTLPTKRLPITSVMMLVGETSRPEVIPNLEFKNLPLAEVLAGLGRQAGLELASAPKMWPWGHVDRRRGWMPALVTGSFSNLTALAALESLADKHGLKPDASRWHREKVLAFVPDRMSLEEILDWYGKSQDEFDQLEEALERPYSRLTPNLLRPDQNTMPNYVGFRLLAQSYASLCKVHLLLGDADAALKDARMMRRLADAVQANEPPTLVEALVKVAMTGLLTHTLEETIADGLWPDTHLAELQRTCEGVDLLGCLSSALRGGERAAILRFVDTVTHQDTGHFLAEFKRIELFGKASGMPLLDRVNRRLIPWGWVDQNKARYAGLFQQPLEGLDATNHRIDLLKIVSAANSTSDVRQGFRPYSRLVAVTMPNAAKAAVVTAKNQVQVHLATIACALERHRAATGAYPENLDTLVPAFMARSLHDIFDGQPFRYRPQEDAKYLLYSVGLNLKDDGGVLSSKEWSMAAESATDWVWQGVPR